MKGNNILAVWDRMGDYHRARVQAVRYAFPDRQVFSADLGSSDALYGWSNTEESLHFQLSSKPPGSFDIGRVIKFIKLLSSSRIGCVCIAGYGRPEYVLFLIYARLTGRKVILFAESWYPSSSLFEKVKSVFLRWTCDGFLVSGKRARDHFAGRLNIDDEKIRTGYSVVDNNYFATQGRTHSRKILCVARFAPEKNLEQLIKSFNSSSLPSKGWELVIVGGGPLQRTLEDRSAGTPVSLANWQSYNELPGVYQSAAVFVLPSLFEPWGLVVNEAMAASLPLILSDKVGCLPDFLREGSNGWSFDTTVPGALTNVFNNVANTSDEALAEMGRQSFSLVKDHSVDLFAANLKVLILLQSYAG
ncbi:MAG TPA: glycosyltransferase family 4 protein [Cyclobacteriaceae bacterium]|nr:glycosyltransferase family 4 protein [Cyclobacteriaceae bacterium]